MPRVSPPVIFRLLAGPLLLAGAAGRAAEADVAQAWELVGQHLPNDAQATLRNAPARAGDRERALAAAVMRLDVQPVTDAGLKAAGAELAELAQGNDEIAQASGYLIGRIYQTHQFTPDYARAAEAYTHLAERFPAGYWAQLGLVKLALLKLYALPEPAGPRARLAAAEALLPRVTVPELRRDLHILLGRAALFHEAPLGEVLPHLVAADGIGGLTQLKRAELQLQIGELSRRAGQWDQAREYLQKFITENGVDGRIATARMRLAQVEAAQRAEGARR